MHDLNLSLARLAHETYVRLKLPQLATGLFQQSIACQARCDRLSRKIPVVQRDDECRRVNKAFRSCHVTGNLKNWQLRSLYINCLRKSTFASIPLKRKFYEAIIPTMNKFKPIRFTFCVCVMPIMSFKLYAQFKTIALITMRAQPPRNRKKPWSPRKCGTLAKRWNILFLVQTEHLDKQAGLVLFERITSLLNFTRQKIHRCVCIRKQSKQGSDEMCGGSSGGWDDALNDGWNNKLVLEVGSLCVLQGGNLWLKALCYFASNIKLKMK